jgi:hypothetical protein
VGDVDRETDDDKTRFVIATLFPKNFALTLSLSQRERAFVLVPVS